jgi:Tfp pilus assembly protein PilE
MAQHNHISLLIIAILAATIVVLSYQIYVLQRQSREVEVNLGQPTIDFAEIDRLIKSGLLA